MMRNWSKTRKRLFKSVEKKEAAAQKKMAAYYRTKAAEIDMLIAASFARRHANGIRYRDMLQPMPQDEKALLLSRCNSFVLSNPDMIGLLPFDRIHRLNQMEGLQTNIRLSMLEIGVYEYEFLHEHLTSIWLETSAAVAAVVEQEMITGQAEKPAPDIKEVRAAIFRSKDKLARYLETDVAQMIARGEPYEAVCAAVCDRMEHVAQNDFNRLMYTEDTEAVNEAAAEIFEEIFETYKIVTAGDERVCKLCRSMEGLVFSFDEKSPGVNFPPFHSWCRCTFEIVEGTVL